MIINILKKLDKKLQLKFLKFLPILVISTILEVLTIGLMYPFIASIISENEGFQIILKYMNIEIIEKNTLIYKITAVLLVVMIIALVVRIYTTKKMFELIYSIGNSISNAIYQDQIKQKYEYYSKTSLPEIQVKINNPIEITQKIISPLVQSITYGLQAVCLIIIIILINPSVALTSLVVLALAYYIIVSKIKIKLRQESEKSNKSNYLRQKIVHESINGIKNIIIEKGHYKYIKIFQLNEAMGDIAKSKAHYLSIIPRFIIETIIIITLITIVVISTYYEISQASMLATYAIIGVAAQKIMPSIQIIFHSWASIESNYYLLKEVEQDLKISKYGQNKNIEKNNIQINKFFLLEIESIDFNRYEKKIFNNFNSKIENGNFVIIFGKTGSGKSTLIDIILGLLPVKSGTVKINGIDINKINIDSWHKHIAYVPQQIYLTDTSLIENIAENNLNEIDVERVKKSLKIAEYKLEIKDLYNLIGDNGSNLSGGQRQRIGIARAIYLNKEILILDEATNALDEETEMKIIENIKKEMRNKLIIMVTHNKALAKHASFSIEIK
jgi:ABC-type multidrug transport system fused ATPase/permease subunit